MSADKVFIRDVTQALVRYKIAIAAICLCSIAFFVQLTFWIEKQYVSTFEINVYSKYFQSPLIAGIIPDTFNIPEMRFAIDSMVKEAISDDVVDQIGRRYQFYSETKDEREIARQRQQLRDRFSYFSTGGQSYQISFSSSDPYIAKKVAEDVLKIVNTHIISKRINTIELVKEVMINKLNSFNASQSFSSRGSEKALASKSPEVLKEELIKLNTNIEALGTQLKDTHPRILALRERRQTILNWLKEFDLKDISTKVDTQPVAFQHNKVVSEQLSSKFYAKYHDFNIALDIEKRSVEGYIGIIKSPQLPVSPQWPKKRLFASLGFLLGLVFAFIYVYIKEALRPVRHEKAMAEVARLDTIYLGELPALNGAKPVKLPILKTKLSLLTRGGSET